MRRKEQLRFQNLPGATGAGGSAPQAGAAFSCPEFISGMLFPLRLLRNCYLINHCHVAGVMNLAPGLTKEEESTAMATQVFYVATGQPKALQVDIGTR